MRDANSILRAMSRVISLTSNRLGNGIFSSTSVILVALVLATIAMIVFFLPLPALDVTNVYNSPFDKLTSSILI
jgi:uncharacterized protein (DUF58 family)